MIAEIGDCAREAVGYLSKCGSFQVFFSEIRHTLGSVRQQIVLIRKDSASVHAGAV